MIKRLILFSVFGYYSVLREGQQPEKALTSAKNLAALLLMLLIVTGLFLTAPFYILDFLGTYLLVSGVSWGLVFHVTSDKPSWQAEQSRFNKHSRLWKLLVSTGFFLALPCMVFFVLYTAK